MPKTLAPPAAPSVPKFAVVLTVPALKTINTCLGTTIPMPDEEGALLGDYDNMSVVEHDETLLLVISDPRGEIRPVLKKAGLTLLPAPVNA